MAGSWTGLSREPPPPPWGSCWALEGLGQRLHSSWRGSLSTQPHTVSPSLSIPRSHDGGAAALAPPQPPVPQPVCTGSAKWQTLRGETPNLENCMRGLGTRCRQEWAVTSARRQGQQGHSHGQEALGSTLLVPGVALWGAPALWVCQVSRVEREKQQPSALRRMPEEGSWFPPKATPSCSAPGSRAPTAATRPAHLAPSASRCALCPKLSLGLSGSPSLTVVVPPSPPQAGAASAPVHTPPLCAQDRP